MIPQQLIGKAARAMHVTDPGGGETEEYEDTPPWYQIVTERRARAALEAVAADIWEDGYEAGEEDGYLMGRDEPFTETAPNPYRASETA